MLRSLDVVDNQLEARRLAIADALREVMAEPLDEPVPAPAEAGVANPPVANVVPLLSAPPLTLVRPPVAEPDGSADDESDATTPAIPPLEPAGQMSPAAAKALFGHH